MNAVPGAHGISIQAEDSLTYKKAVGLSILLVAGGINKHVETVLHPVEGTENVAKPAGINGKHSDADHGHVAEEEAQADDTDGGAHTLVAG
jgi:hypothetical protein